MTTATYQPDETASSDTYIHNQFTTTNFGTSGVIILSGNGHTYPSHGILRFDISDISASKICTSATLYLYLAQLMSGQQIDVYSIKSGNSGWTESGTTWNTIDGSNSWAGSVGCSTSGTDYESASIGSSTVPVSSPAGTELSFSLNTTVVKTWFGPSNQNYGMLLSMANIYTGSFYSSSGSASYRPKLVVVYSAAGVTYRRTFQPMGLRAGSRRES